MAKKPKPLPEADQRKINRQNLSKLAGIFRYVLPYKTQFFWGMICLVLGSLTLLAFPFVAARLVDAAAGQSSWFLTDLDSIALSLLGVLMLQAIFSFLRVYLFAQVSEQSMAGLRLHLYQKFLFLPPSFFDTHRTGDLLSRIISDVSLLQDTFSSTLAEFVRQLITLTVGTFIIFFFTPKLAVFMLTTFPVLVVAGMFFGRFIRKITRKMQDEVAQANIVIEETLQAVPIVKAFTNELYELSRYFGHQKRVVGTALRAARYRGAFISFVIFALLGGIVAVIWYGAHLVQQGELTLGELVSFVLFTTFIGGSIAGLGDLYGQIQKSIGASERILQILTLPDEAAGQLTAIGPQQHFSGIEKRLHAAQPQPLPMQGEVTYQNIRFTYPTRPEVEVLRGINLQIKPGEKIALVGASGAGKSTLVQLLLRFYSSTQGQLLVDGQPIDSLNLKAYRANIGIVPQEVILFGGTITENIRYGRQGATDAEVREAARQANALGFIENFPEGFDTLVGERGIKLSGGQRQRIAIARAILKNPKILILDEATSSLDAESERLVQDALTTLMQNRTTIIIAHRLVTVRQANRIYVMEEGQIAEQGTHEELLRHTAGRYTKLVKLQLQEQ